MQEDEEIMNNRKSLIEHTKKFKQITDQEEKLEALPGLLRLYQTEIDGLASRCTARTEQMGRLSEENHDLKTKLHERTKEHEQTSIQLAQAMYDLESAQMIVEEKSRLLDELKSSIDGEDHVVIYNQNSNVQILKRENDRALEQIRSLQVRVNLYLYSLDRRRVDKHWNAEWKDQTAWRRKLEWQASALGRIGEH